MSESGQLYALAAPPIQVGHRAVMPRGRQPLRRRGIRTATTDGIIMLTFTPLEGMSEVVLGFLPAEMRPQDDS